MASANLMKTNVYVDGFNLYYGCVKGTPHRWLDLAQPPVQGPRTVEVVRSEEKGSDVNLATALLVDGFTQDFNVAVVVSNDSDLLAPIRVVREQLGCRVGVLNPHPRKRRSRALFQVATFWKQMSRRALQASQFPHTLTDAHGTITKPQGW